jgi:LysM repeat protein
LVRRRLVRVAAPAAFLLAATIAVLVVRAGLRADDDDSRQPVTVARTTTTRDRPTTTTRSRQPQRTYVVQPGDTLDQIALEFDATVEELIALNPNVEPTELRPGQRLRVP